jgi:hypothetical protein
VRSIASLAEITSAVRFFAGVPRSLRRTLASDEARAVLARRRRDRAADFLALAGRTIYGNPASPYRRLLRLAGCEPGDLARLVAAQGLEGALSSLHARGVYLTLDEFKGRRPVVRGSVAFDVAPEQLHNPLVAGHVSTQTSGSGGPRLSVPFSLPSIHDRAVNTRLTTGARDGLGWRHGFWGAPGGYVSSVLRCSRAGTPLIRWFSQLDPRSPDLDRRYRLAAVALRGAALVAGRRPPPIEPVALDDPAPIVEWLRGERRAGRTPHLYTYVSPAVRLARAALDGGDDLHGVQLTVTGEPLTETRLSAIRGAGADVVADYGCIEAGGFLSYGCLAPEAPDDVHLFDDIVALVQPGDAARPRALPARALLITTLRDSTPLILLNVSTGDEAAVVTRACGCPLEALGWRTHLSGIRSFEKLTSGGMTFLGTDVIRVLEVVLPARFGGGPTDYQLVEEEAEDGRPRLRLVVHQALGPVPLDAVADAFLSALGADSPAARQMELQWRQSALLRVERGTPRATVTGKILHLFREQGVAGRPDR